MANGSYPQTDRQLGQTVLVVDDSDDCRLVLRVMLEVAGFDVLEAEDGHLALVVLRKHPEVTVMVLDGMMPTLSGGPLVRAMKSDPRFRDVAVIACDSLNPEEWSDSWGVTGEDLFAFATKPFNPDYMVDLVLQASRQAHSPMRWVTAAHCPWRH